MSEFRQRGSCEAYNTRLKRLDEQRRKKHQAPINSTQQRLQIYSIEDIPFDGSLDRLAAKPSASQQTSTPGSPFWSTDRATNSSCNDYSQRSVQPPEPQPVFSIGFDSRDPPRNVFNPQNGQDQKQRNQTTQNGWIDSHQHRTAAARLRTTFDSQPPTPPEQTTATPPTRIKTIQPDRFQQWQTEATQLWNRGEDANFEERPANEKKKRAGWLTKEEVESYSTTALNNNQHSPYLRPPPSPSAQQQQRQLSLPQSTVVTVPKNPPPPTSSPSESAEFATRLTSNLQSQPGVLLFFDAIDSGLVPYKLLADFLPTLVKYPLDNRCVDKLLTIVINAPADVQPELLFLIGNTPTLLHHYLPWYICLPRDMILILDFLQALFTHYPATLSSSSSSSWSDGVKKLQEHYDKRLKPWFPPSTYHSINDRLQKVLDMQTNAHDAWGGWTITEKPEEKTDDAPKQYLQDQLALHQQHIAALCKHAIELTSSSSSSHPGWLVLENVQWYCRSTVLTPVTPEPAHVYLAPSVSSCKQILDRHLIGCVAILVSSYTAPLFGTTIEYANHRSNGKKTDQYLIAIHHSSSPNSQQRYNLVLTNVSAAPLLALADWLRSRSHSANVTDINTSLAMLVPLWPLTMQQRRQQHQLPVGGGVPDYLDRLSLDVSAIMAPNYRGCKANISENSWPILQSKHLRLPDSHRPPLYTLSNSQIKCLQYALSHRYAYIDGPSGSGKSYVASKCLALVSQAIQRNSLHRPILVLCDSIHDIMSLVRGVSQDTTVILGSEQHAMDSATLPTGSREAKQYRHYSRELESCVARVAALQQHRDAVVDKRQSQYVANLMPPSYRKALYDNGGNGKMWLHVQDDHNDQHSTTSLVKSISQKPNPMIPLMARTDFVQQQAYMHDHPVSVVPLSDDGDWPFLYMEDSRKLGDWTRYTLKKIWEQVAPEDIWHLSVDARRELYYNKILPAYDAQLVKVLKNVQGKQSKVLAMLHQLRVTRWRGLCNFSRVVAMPIAFALAHTSLLRAIEPLVVIMDVNKHKVSGAMLAALALGSDTQHVMIFGGNGTHGYGVGGSQQRLEEQWRMSSFVWQLWQAAVEHPGSWLVDLAKQESKTSMTGTKYSTYCVALDNNKHDNTNDAQQGQGLVVQWLTQLVCYLYQQGVGGQKLVVLVTSSEAVAPLIQALAQQQETIFAADLLDNITVTSVMAYHGREADIVVMGVMDGVMPMDAQLSMALSRAKSAVFIVGLHTTLAKHPLWLRVLNFMKSQDRCSNFIPLVCQNHPETETVIQQIDDFVNVLNGGCNALCGTIMDCGHPCQKKCHHRSHDWVKCQQPCEQPRENKCSHPCTKLCYECTSGCPPCMETVTITFDCGHPLQVLCHEQDAEHSCRETVKVDLPCGHAISGTCGCLPLCTSLCLTLLECGHPCQQLCGVEHEHDRSMCTFECPKKLICGHQCAKGCAKPNDHTERCLQHCARLCSHGYKCAQPCWKVCVPCKAPCPHQCQHSQCTKKCFETCNRVPCNVPCSKLLSCSHPCRGLCGEPCSTCVICQPDVQCSITLRTLSEFTEDECVYTLPECGCSFSLDGLDQYFRSRVKSGEHTAIKQWVCPSCQSTILTAPRYADLIKAEFNLIDTIKKQQEDDFRRLTDEERLHIVNAMNEEPNNHVNDIVGGRWFVCKNRHPYFIGDCGGATEMSSCPECNEPIGGSQHQVVQTNRFYGEFDGSSQPAWPGQPGS